MFLLLVGTQGSSAALPAPRLIAPGDGWNVSQVAADFRWEDIDQPAAFVKDQEGEMKKPLEKRMPAYHLQVSESADFTHLVRNERLPVIEWKQGAGQRYVPEHVLPEGKYFWRVGAVGSDGTTRAWSSARMLTVSKAEIPKPLMREISARKPLLVVGQRVGSRGPGNPYLPVTFDDPDPTTSDPAPALPLSLIPKEMRPYLGLFFWRNVLGHNVEDMKPHYDAARDAGVVVFMRGVFSLSEIEWAYRHYPETIVGVDMDEMGGWWTYYPKMYRRFLERAVKISAANGRYFLQAEGDYRALPSASLLEDKEWMDFMRVYGQYTIWGGKSNISPVLHATQAMYRGLWLDGVTGNYCVWAEGFFWDHAGFRKLGECGTYRQYWKDGAAGYYPGVMWPQTFTAGAAQGASVYVVSGWQLLWDKELKPPQPIWMHYTMPLFKALVEKQLIVNREEALAQTKVAVEVKAAPKTNQPSLYSHYDALFRNTYGLNFPGADYSDLIPDNGRYYFHALVSPLVPRAHAHIKTVGVDDVNTDEEVRSVFDAAYPAFSEGNAWVCRVGEKFYIENSNENRDITQRFKLPLGTRGVTQMSGPISLHTYIVGKTGRNGRTVWLQANSHHRAESRNHGRAVVEAPVRDTEISFRCDSEPKITVTPATGLKAKTWSPSSTTLTVTLSHIDASGAVELELTENPDE